MGAHYIALVGTNAPGSALRLSDKQAAFLRSRDMHRVHVDGPLALFVSRDTPTLFVPGGVVVGDLFCNNGKPAESENFSAQRDDDSIVESLLTRYWGDYILLHASASEPGKLGVMRDPSGAVPCFYSYGGDVGFVTSEVSLATGLELHYRQIDWGFVSQALAYPHVNTARTGVVDVRELLPGCSLVLQGSSASTREEWSPWAFVSAPHRHSNCEDASAEIRTAVSTVVNAFASADKSVLMELSGGLDSSIVAMCLDKTQARIACCSLVTPVPGADERQYALEVAQALGVELHTEGLAFANADIGFALPLQPSKPRMSVLQHVSQQAMAAAADALGTRSFFSGGGGDTVFCYVAGAVPAADAFREAGFRAGLKAVRDLSTLHQCTYWKAARLTLRKLRRGAKTPFKANTSLLHPSIAIPELDRHPWFKAPADTLAGDRERVADLAGTQVFREGAPRGATHRLRLPLLSQPVMEACLKAPTWMWIAGGENRALARAAFAQRLPQAILERRSKGTFMNYLGAIYQRKKPAIRDYLLSGHLQAQGLLDTEALETFFKGTLPPRDTSFMRTFDLCMIENWIRHQR